jgi:hypothetical protein
MYAETVSDILVFKTNLAQKNDIEKAGLLLNAEAAIRHWNVDCDDIDHVLRIEADNLNPSQVISILMSAGFTCEELPD